MKINIKLQLSIMMFLNFFVWGIWFVTMGTYLTMGKIGATGGQTGLAYGTQCLGAIIAPFIIGFIADRFFAAQKILGVLHLAGAALLYYISTQSSFDNFYSLLLIYMIIYMPTLALVNAIALKQITNAEKEFSGIRVWGTIGWIVSGLLIALLGWEKSPSSLDITFKVAAIISIILSVFCFFLPDTPPQQKGKVASFSQMIGLDALKVLKDKNYLIFFIASVLICIPLAFYYGSANQFLNEVGMSGAAGKMTMGQMSETIFLFLMPFFFKRFGIKQMLLIGMVAWVLRYLLFSYGNMEGSIWMLYLGIILHGICYDFFFVTGQIYTDQKSDPSLRSSSQGLITLATYGVGMFFGFMLAGNKVDSKEFNDGLKFNSVGVKSKIAIADSLNQKLTLLKIDSFLIDNQSNLTEILKNKKSNDIVKVSFLKNNTEESENVKVKNFSSNYGKSISENGINKLGFSTNDSINKTLIKGISISKLNATHNWQTIWLFPCIFAAGVSLLFFVFFKNDKNKIANA